MRLDTRVMRKRPDLPLIPNVYLYLDDYLGDLLQTPEERAITNPYKDWSLYQDDPVTWCREILRDRFTPDVTRMMKSVVENDVTICKTANAVGKTFAAARLVIWFYMVYTDAQVYVFAAPPEENLRNLLWGQIASIVERHPDLFIGHDISLPSMMIKRNELSFITGVRIPVSGIPQQRESKFSGKHAPHLMFVGDEADAVPGEVFSGIESCMSGGHARLMVMFNPRHEAGPLYQMERAGAGHIVNMSAFTHPNVISGTDRYPGAVTRETTVRRINEWSRPLAEGEPTDMETFEVPKYLVGKTAKAYTNRMYDPLPAGFRKITNPAFYYMVLGQYPAMAENQLISRAWIEAAVSRHALYTAQYGEKAPANIRGIMGLDVADLGLDKNAFTPRYGGYVPRIHIWSGVDPSITEIKARDLFFAGNGSDVMVDSTGVGAGVAPHLRKLKVRAHRVMVASTPTEESELGQFRILRDQGFWSLREWLRTDPGAMLPNDPELIEELLVLTYWIDKGKVMVTDSNTIREKLKRSPDKASSLMLTFCPIPQESAGTYRKSRYI